MSKRFNSHLPAVLVLVALMLGACAPTGKTVKEGQVAGERPKVAVDAATEKLFRQGVTLMKAERFDDAAKVFEAVIAKNGQLAGPYVNLGIAYSQLDRNEEAERVLQQAIDTNPSFLSAYNELGIVYRKTGKFEQARGLYERALTVNPDYDKAHLNLGVLCDLYLQDLDCALKHYERYQQLAVEEDKQVAIWIADLQQRIGVARNETGG